jgi:short-subunit dehydrogenase
MNYWSNKVVMITGASSGIGRSLAAQLAQRGARVGLIARRVDLLSSVVREVEQYGNAAVGVAADVHDADGIKSATDQIVAALGPIDVLIANAGIATATHATKLHPDELASVLQTNVVGAANSVAAVLPAMMERGKGHLVAIASLSAYRGLPMSAAYCASKAALSSFFESLRIDLKDSGVKVTIVYPGFIKTPLTAGREYMPYLMEVEYAAGKIISAIERGKKSYAFPWQLATLVRAGLIMPASLYDWIAARNNYRK